MLPQFRALEAPSADNNPETGRSIGISPKVVPLQGREERAGQLSSSPSQSKDCPNVLGEPLKGPGESPRDPPRVFVLNRSGDPLMPTYPRKARKLLRKGKAVVVKRAPFTIRLKYGISSSNVQPVELKLDPGSKFTGIALVANDQPIFLSELEHRGQVIHQNLTSRAQLRRRRRTANLRYRPARFNNRRKSDGWLAPSLRHRLETTMSWVSKLRKIVPITGFAQELVRFDTQQMVNPEISGVQYQQGELAGYEVKEYLLEKWGRKCVYCGAEEVPLEVEHIVAKSRGGTDRVSNLTLACHSCNQAKGGKPIEEFLRGKPDTLRKVKSQVRQSLKDASAVNSTRWALFNALKDTGLPVRTGTGGRTKWNRKRFGVPKGHALDALCVGEMDRLKVWAIPVAHIKCVGRGSHQRVMTDQYGFPRTKLGNPQNKKNSHELPVRTKGPLQSVKGLKGKRPQGFSTGDIVRLLNGRIGRVIGARVKGAQGIRVEEKEFNVSASKLRLINKSNGYGFGYSTSPTSRP